MKRSEIIWEMIKALWLRLMFIILWIVIWMLLAWYFILKDTTDTYTRQIHLKPTKQSCENYIYDQVYNLD